MCENQTRQFGLFGELQWSDKHSENDGLILNYNALNC